MQKYKGKKWLNGLSMLYVICILELQFLFKYNETKKANEGGKNNQRWYGQQKIKKDDFFFFFKGKGREIKLFTYKLQWKGKHIAS